MNKLYLLMLAAGFSSTALAQEKFELGKPNNDAYRYLDEYKGLKEYIDKDKYPNFKLGAGTTVSDYNKKSLVYKMTNANFTETVAGNAMKMASCVDGNGNMNFGTVTSYVNNATAAGLNVYGHTLAWHSQQANGWLKKLIADKPAPELEDGDTTVWSQVAIKDFRTSQSVGWKADESTYGYTLKYDATNGLKITTTKSYGYEVQFVGFSDILTTKGKSYKITATIKGSKSGKLNCKMGDWGGGANFSIPFTAEWKDVELTVKPTMESNFFLIQVPNYIGDVYIKSIKIEESRMGKTMSEERRCLKAHATAKKADAWDNQMWIIPGSFANGASYTFTADVRADKAATASTQIHSTPGTYAHYEALGTISFNTEWKKVTISGKFSAAGESIAFNLNEFAGENNYYFDNVSLKINGVEKVKNGDFEGTDVSSFKVKENQGAIVAPAICENLTYIYLPGTIAQSAQEVHDTLVYAMDKWISGMMKACGGKVKAWDLVNEAISGGGNDGQGNYLLQHRDGYVAGENSWDVGGDAFYWQDYMGDLEYVRQACRLARKYGPEDVKLFINDYNLESTWDSNKKVKSLVGWIKKWEADGVTKIDGIGTQMHISYYLDKTSQENQKKCITNMFTIMAQSGKLVRVSELDMGLCDKQFGTAKKTSELTEEEHKLMADYYEWIIKEYLRIIPAEQQWGICQWCTTDAPASSGWRGGEPVGIWDLNYYRKHTYAGFVRGLGGKVYNTDIQQISNDKKIDASKGIYSINGMKLQAKSLDELPSGLYIIGGKKVIK